MHSDDLFDHVSVAGASGTSDRLKRGRRPLCCHLCAPRNGGINIASKALIDFTHSEVTST